MIQYPHMYTERDIFTLPAILDVTLNRVYYRDTAAIANKYTEII